MSVVEITFKVAVSSSMAKITLKVPSVADISFLEGKITFAASEIIIKKDVISF